MTDKRKRESEIPKKQKVSVPPPKKPIHFRKGHIEEGARPVDKQQAPTDWPNPKPKPKPKSKSKGE